MDGCDGNGSEIWANTRKTVFFLCIAICGVKNNDRLFFT